MKTWLMLIPTICLVASVQAAPLRGDYFWAAKTGEVTQEMGRYSRLALQHSHDPAVLAHAQKIIAETANSFQALATVAESREIPLSTGPTAAQQREFEAMGRLQGSEFDRAYWKEQQNAATALELCRSQALARSHDPVLSQALRGVNVEAATR